MKNNEKKELLTSELYQKISTSKSGKIAELKNMRGELLKQIKDEKSFLKELELQQEQLAENIKMVRKNISIFEKRKFKLNRDMNKQRRIVGRLNKLATKEESYVDVRSFYPEENIKTR